MSPTASTVDEYLASVPEDARASLEKLRATIQAAAPQATEGMGYGVPAYKYRGVLVSFGAAKSHCAFYVQSPAVMEAHKQELAAFDTAKGTVRFPFDQPLPEAIVTKLVRARVAENEAARKK